MATLPSYIPLRDDAGVKSISKNEREFIRKCALNKDRVLRLDGRTKKQSRPTRLVLTRYPNGASGTTLQWGMGTRVTVGCTGSIVPPLERPNEGIINISVELSPSASTSFRQVAPVTNMGSMGGNRGAGTADEAQKLQTNSILRALERLLSSCLDAEALVVTPGQWVWKLSVTVVVLDAAAGNLLDACWMATLAALQHYRQPHTEARNVEGENQNNPLAPIMLSLDSKEGTPLPLHQVPFAISFALITEETDSSERKVVYLQDPSQQEEMIAAGRLTYALNVHQEVCLVDFGGGAEISHNLLKEIHEAAAKQVRLLSKALQETLARADEEAIQQRLKSLKLQQPNISAVATEASDDQDLPPLPEGDIRSPDDIRAEEEYRQIALNYNLGHVAQPLADERRPFKQSSSKGTSALLATLLQTASRANEDTKSEEQYPENVEKSPQTTRETKTDLKKSKARASTGKDVDSDEEDTTMQLQSEFSGAPALSSSTAHQQQKPADKLTSSSSEKVLTVDEEDVDDLAAAIKTKKKKKKKK